MTNHRIHQAASQHAPHITLTVNRVNHAAITHLNNFAAPQHSLHPGATSNAAHNTVTRRTTLAATNHTDGSAIALHMTHTTIINDRPHAATREHRSDNTTTRHHANTTINLHNLTAARHRTNVTASRQTQHASITGHNIDARHRSRSILAPVVAHIIQPRVTRHLIQPAPTHADTPETAANDTTIHTRQHTSVATIRVQRMTATAVNNVNHTVAATIPPGNISAAHALSRLPVTPVKTARSIHAQTIHATKSLTQPRHAANLAVMTALTDAWNALTDEQRDDFTSNVGNYDQVAVPIAIEGDSAHLVDDDWHEEIGADNQAADTYVRAVETALRSIDSGAQYLGETWDGADPEEGISYRPLSYTEGDLDTARNMHAVAAQHMAQLLAAE